MNGKEVLRSQIDLARFFESVARVAIESERAATEAKYQATHDSLTGALNRDGLREYLSSAEAPKAVLIVDATNFKSINDKCGYSVGDLVIGETYRVLRAAVRENDVIARWGGDEFVIILNGEEREQEPGKLVIEKRANHTRADHIDPAKQRIASELKKFLSEYKELQDLNFDLAVGGIEWPGNVLIEDLIDEAEKEMKKHKSRQHKNDRRQLA